MGNFFDKCPEIYEMIAWKSYENVKKSGDKKLNPNKYRTVTMEGGLPILSAKIINTDCKTAEDLFAAKTVTWHSMIERKARVDHVDMEEKIVKAFWVDKGHRNGPEKHFITDKAHDIIFNDRTGEFITILNCRPQQVKRFYDACGIQAPANVLKEAKDNLDSGRNNDFYDGVDNEREER